MCVNVFHAAIKLAIVIRSDTNKWTPIWLFVQTDGMVVIFDGKFKWL
jgi:hypothetical protein